MGVAEHPHNQRCGVGEAFRVQHGRFHGPAHDDDRWRLVGFDEFDDDRVGCGDLARRQGGYVGDWVNS
jgi:hypothetical protein